jgi:hypothetical protein
LAAEFAVMHNQRRARLGSESEVSDRGGEPREWRRKALIVVDQPDALIDQSIAIALRGLTPRQPVSVTATQSYTAATCW